jgi:hypothetical protein
VTADKAVGSSVRTGEDLKRASYKLPAAKVVRVLYCFFVRGGKMRKILLIFLLVGFTAISQATLVDSFESYDTGNVRDVADPPWTALGGTGQADIFGDGTGNKVLGFGWNSGWRGCARGLGPVADTSSATTLFMRWYVVNDQVDHSVGLSDLAVGDMAQWFDDFEVQIAGVKDATADDGLLDMKVRDGGSTTTVAQLSTGQWYNIWAVIDQTADTYDVYVTTGTADATVSDRVADDFAFRNGTTDSLVSFLACGYNAPDQQDLWVDDIHLTDGQDLSYVPEPMTIALLGLGGLAVFRRRK